MDDIGTRFLAFLVEGQKKRMLRPGDEPTLVYDRIRRFYVVDELRSKINPGDREADEMQMSGDGPDPYQDLNLWYTFCDSHRLDITQPPPERPEPPPDPTTS